MMSLVIPSLKYSCSGSSLKFLNGRTAMEALRAAAGTTVPDGGSIDRSLSGRCASTQKKKAPAKRARANSPPAAFRSAGDNPALRTGLQSAAVPIRPNPINPDRSGDVFYPEIAQFLTPEFKFVFDLFESASRYTDAPGRCQGFQTGRHIHPVTINPLAVDDHIAEIDADAKQHAPLLGQGVIAHFQVGLDLEGTLHRLDHTVEFGQQIVTGRVDHPPAMMMDQAGHRFFVSCQRADGRGLVQTHQAAVARHVGAENSREFASYISGVMTHLAYE